MALQPMVLTAWENILTAMAILQRMKQQRLQMFLVIIYILLRMSVLIYLYYFNAKITWMLLVDLRIGYIHLPQEIALLISPTSIQQMWRQHSVLANLLALPLLHKVLHGQSSNQSFVVQHPVR